MNKEQAEFQRLWNKIGSSGIMILSTCADIRVTSRAMSVVVIDGKFYCQTALAIISLCALQGYLQILPQKRTPPYQPRYGGVVISAVISLSLVFQNFYMTTRLNLRICF